MFRPFFAIAIAFTVLATSNVIAQTTVGAVTLEIAPGYQADVEVVIAGKTHTRIAVMRYQLKGSLQPPERVFCVDDDKLQIGRWESPIASGDTPLLYSITASGGKYDAYSQPPIHSYSPAAINLIHVNKDRTAFFYAVDSMLGEADRFDDAVIRVTFHTQK